MNQQITSLAKLTAPKAKGVYPRERLFDLLNSYSDQQVIWISAQAGSGKTTLAASYLTARNLPALWYQVDEGEGDIASFFYFMGLAMKKHQPQSKKPLPLLTPEYMSNIPVFTRRFFEKFFSCLKPESKVILDNYQEIPLNSGFHEMMVHGLDVIPEKIQVIILSRLDPPAQFARLRANSRLRIIGWDAMRFKGQESKGLLETTGHTDHSSRALDLLNEKTQGWAAGLILLSATDQKLTADNRQYIESNVNPAFSYQDIFDYFSNEIFNKFEPAIQDVLLRTSLFQKIDPATAEKLTENKMTGQILERLSKDHFFTERYGQTFQYHPLFRDFLLNQVKVSLDPENVIALQKKAAALLEESLQIEEAALLYRQAGDWGKFIRLILSQAQSIMVQGRSAALLDWIDSIPLAITNKTSWLLFWKGICKLPYVPIESRALLEQAFHLFEAQGDQVGLFLAWSNVVQTFMVEIDDFRPLDPWIQWLEKRDSEGPLSFPSAEIKAATVSGMIGALRWRIPNHANIKKWVNSSLTLTKEGLNINTYLRVRINCEYYYFWMGEFAEASLLINEMESFLQTEPNASPLMVTMLKTLAALLYNTSVKTSNQAIKAVTEGAEISLRTGVHLMDPLLFVMGVIAALNRGELKEANEYLARAEKAVGNNRRADSFPFIFLSVWYNLCSGNLQKAAALAKNTSILAEKIGSPIYSSLIQLALVLALYDTGEISEAIQQLTVTRNHVWQTGSAFFEYLYYLTEAHFAFAQKQDHVALEALRKALSWARQKDYASMAFFWRPGILSRLCSRALDAGIEVEYVQSFIRQLNLAPDPSYPVVENWPYPLKIITLGGFEIIRDGKALRFTGKTQQKPLAFLKSLIAFGCINVAEDAISDILWPEAEGDAAHKSFVMTLIRLRKLLGDDRAIIYSDGKVSIDLNRCFIDLALLEKAIRCAEEPIAQQLQESFPMEIISDSLQKCLPVISLYKGAFLPGEERFLLINQTRKRLSAKMVRLFAHVATLYEKCSEWPKVLESLEKALNVDNLSEEIYQRLMLCHHQMGQRSEAVRIYRQCEEILSAALGIKPSRKTMEIYQEILNS